MSFDYIRNHYGVSAKRGDRVEWTNSEGRTQEGTVTSATHYLHVRFDGAKHAMPLHPTDEGLRFLPHNARVKRPPGAPAGREDGPS